MEKKSEIKLSETLQNKRNKKKKEELFQEYQAQNTIKEKLKTMTFEQIMDKYYWKPLWGQRWKETLIPKLAENIARMDYKKGQDKLKEGLNNEGNNNNSSD